VSIRTENPVPFVDLGAQYASIQDEIDAAIREVIAANAFIGGPFVRRFEEAFAAFCGTAHAVGVGSGTDALELALEACGIGPGDEVVTVPTSFIATTEAISAVGATIRFAEVEPETGNLDPEAFAAALTPRTRAVIPVHLYGQPAEMDPILAIARERGIRVVGDAAQAHAARYRGRPIGTLGDAVCFSFYPGKNLGAYGDAGAVVSDDAEITERIRMRRNHGRTEKYEHLIEGCNSRLDGLQAAILSVKLRHLEAWTRSRQGHAAAYSAALAGVPDLALPPFDPEAPSVQHLYVVRTPQRDAVLGELKARGIGAAIHYPIPLHLQPAYAHLGHARGDFPHAERFCAQCLSLPMCPELSEAQRDRVVGELRNAVGRAR
jgi:dTDP-4-amino-4,6-dideoxygalactose transaminase